MMKLRLTGPQRSWLPLAAVFFAVGLQSALAQPPQPVVTFVFPAGAARSQTVEATINGKDFQNASDVPRTAPADATLLA